MHQLISICIYLVIGIYFSKSLFNLYRIVYVDTLPDLYQIPATKKGVHNHCNFTQQHIRIAENVNTFGEVKKYLQQGLFGATWEPVLFKKFVGNPEKKWDAVMKEHHNASLLFSEVELKSFGNVFLPGIRSYGKIETTLGEAFSSATQTANHSYFASFAPFLDKDTSKHILSMNDHEYKSILIDTNFVSNFEKTVLATAIHSAVPPNSYAVQLVGRKLWIFLPPDEMEAFDAINVGPTILFSGSEAEMASKKGRYIVAVQEEGDLLYFPPQWGHAVVTKSGINVMCNVREFSILQSFLTYPRKVLEGLIAKAYLDGFSAPFNHAKMNSAQLKMKSYLEDKYMVDEVFASPNSGCKDKWIDMLNK